MSIRGAAVAGTVASVAVTAVWSWSAALTIGPPPPLHLGRDLPGDYARLADAACGNGGALFAVVAAIYFMCFLVSGLRRRRRQRRADANKWEPARQQNLPHSRSVSQGVRRNRHPAQPGGRPAATPGPGKAATRPATENESRSRRADKRI
jgi:hypothetical protein